MFQGCCCRRWLIHVACGFEELQNAAMILEAFNLTFVEAAVLDLLFLSYTLLY